MKVLSRSGKPEVLTNPHRPYGSNKSSLQEIRRIREAGGWVCFFFYSWFCFSLALMFSIFYFSKFSSICEFVVIRATIVIKSE